MFSHFSDHLIEKKNIIMSLSVSYGSLCIILDVTPFQQSLHYDRGQEEEATHVQFVWRQVQEQALVSYLQRIYLFVSTM